MATLARNMAILTLPALAVGGLAGLALHEIPSGDEPAPRTHEPAAQTPVAEPRAPRERERSTERAGRTRRVIGTSIEGVKPLDPAYGERLSSPDAAVRHACALEILRMGGSKAAAADLLAPTTPEGVKLRDALVNSLTVLGMIERGGSWEAMPEQGRLEVQLKYYAKVLPDPVLRDERRRYWTMRAPGDAERVASGAIDPGEAAWSALELARVRCEAGEITRDQWVKVRAEQVGSMRAWLAKLESTRGVPRDRLTSVREALARIESE